MNSRTRSTDISIFLDLSDCFCISFPAPGVFVHLLDVVPTSAKNAEEGWKERGSAKSIVFLGKVMYEHQDRVNRHQHIC